MLETNPSSQSSMTTFQDIEELLILFHKFCKLRIKHCTLDKFYKEIKEFKIRLFYKILSSDTVYVLMVRMKKSDYDAVDPCCYYVRALVL